MSSGKVLVWCLLVGCGLAAGGAWFYQMERTGRALDFWKADQAYLLRTAPHVVYVEVSREADPGGGAPWNQAFAGAAGLVASDWRGLVNLRQALIEDSSFRWETLNKMPVPDWSAALRFSEETAESRLEAIVLLGPEQGWVGNLRDRRWVRLNEFITQGLNEFLADQLESVQAEEGSELP